MVSKNIWSAWDREKLGHFRLRRRLYQSKKSCEGKFCFSHLTNCDSDVIFHLMHEAFKAARESSNILITNLLLTEIQLMQIEKDIKIFFKFPFSTQIILVFSPSGAARTI